MRWSPETRTCRSQPHEEEKAGQDDEDGGEEDVDNKGDCWHREGILQFILEHVIFNNHKICSYDHNETHFWVKCKILANFC